MKRPFFSITIVTYNAERTLEHTLKSIREQSIAQEELEILVIDGGSTDKTGEIALKYGSVLLDNPKRLPEWGKAIGVSHAAGHYIVRMDSDEEFSYHTQLQEKMDFLKRHPEVKILIPNRYIRGERKETYGIATDYINIFGDPFSYFVYHTKMDKYETYRKNIIIKEGKCAIMKFERGEVYPLTDSGTTVFSLDYIKNRYLDTYDSIEFTCSVLDRIVSDTKLCGCIKGDDIKHNSSASFQTYLKKLRFRVINNMFHAEESGFSSKARINDKLRYKKILFCMYALLFPLPIIDSIRLSFVYKNPSYLLHFVYLYYVCIQIAICGTAKILGKDCKNKNYGK